jgi:hypothetical protein
LHHSGTKALKENISAGDKFEKDLQTLRGFQVERHMTLVAVEIAEKKTIGKKSPVLDGDNFGTMVGEDHRTVWPGQHPGQIEHTNAGESTS